MANDKKQAPLKAAPKEPLEAPSPDALIEQAVQRATEQLKNPAKDNSKDGAASEKPGVSKPEQGAQLEADAQNSAKPSSEAESKLADVPHAPAASTPQLDGLSSTADRSQQGSHEKALSSEAATGDAYAQRFQLSNFDGRDRALTDSTDSTGFDPRNSTAERISNQISDFARSYNVGVSNQAPSNILLSNHSLSENAANNAVVGILSATDSDSSSHSFSLLDDAGGRFAISGSNLVVNNSSLLNYEAATSHAVTVRVTDGGGLSYEKDFTINLTNANEAPSDIALSANSVAENAADNTVVGSLSRSDPDNSDIPTYTLTDNAGGRFAISGSNLVVNNSSLLNYEAATSHAVTVRVTDAGGLSYDKNFTINVTNANEAPTDIALSANSVAENAADNTVVGSLSRSDPDNSDIPTYTLTDNAGGRFAISGSNLIVNNSSLLNYEAATSHAVTVRVTDAGGLSYDKNFTINVTNANEAPSDIALSANSIAENSANNAVIGVLSRTDADSGDTATYTLTDSAGGRFAISGSNLIVNNSSLLNYEAATSHAVTVRVTDAGGLSYDKSFTINLTNTNEAPSDIALSANSIAENSANNTVIGSLSRTDVDSGDTATYTLTDSAGGRFAISGTNLIVNNSSLLDYETATSHNITVCVTDAGGLTYDKNFTINVTDVAGQTLEGTNGANTLSGGAEGDTVTGGYGGDTLSGGAGNDVIVADNTAFSSSAISGTNLTAWYDASNSSTVIRSGNNVSGWNNSVTNANATNNANLSTLSTPSFSANAIGGRDAMTLTNTAYFASSGQVSNTALFGADVGNTSTSATMFFVQKTTALDDMASIYWQNVPGDGTNRVNLHSTLSNGQSYFDFGSAGGAGRINASTPSGLSGQWSVTGAIKDPTTMTVTVNGATGFSGSRSDDLGFGSATLYIGYEMIGQMAEVLIFNEALSSSQQAQVNEYLAMKYGIALSGTNFGTDVLTGGSGADRFVWTNASYSNGSYIDQITDFSVAEGDSVDLSGIASTISYNSSGSFSALGFANEFIITQSGLHTVLKLDLGGDGVADYQIQLNNFTAGNFNPALHLANSSLNYVPTDIILSANSIAENSANNTVVGSLSASDANAAGLTYSIVSDASGIFGISGANLIIANNTNLNFEAASSRNVTIRVTDSSGAAYNETFTINVTNANEAPTDIALSANSIAENSANNTVIGSLSRTDVDSGDTATYSLTNSASGRFAISGTNLIVNNSSLLDYETATSHNITVRVTDAGGLTYDKNFTINLTDAAGQTLTGTSAANSLSGGGESDSITGGYGGDTLSGGGGNDTIYADNQLFTTNSNMTVWIDANNSSSITYNSSNNQVSRLYDIGSGGNSNLTLTSSNAANTVYTANIAALGGRSAVSVSGGANFSAANVGMYSELLNSSAPQNNHFFAVIKTNSINSFNNGLLDLWSSSRLNFMSAHGGNFIIDEGNTTAGSGRFTTAIPSGSGYTDGAYQLFEVSRNSNTLTITWYNSVGTGSVSGSVTASIADGATTLYMLGFAGAAAEAMLYKTYLSSSERSSTLEYLSQKYSIALSGLSLGYDTLTGAAGNDTFSWTNSSHSGKVASANADIVTDFKQGNTGSYSTGETDYLNFNGMNLTLAAIDYNQATPSASFTGSPNSLIWSNDGSGRTIVSVDFGTDRSADMQIQLNGNMWLFGDEFQNVSGISTGTFTSGTNTFNPGNNAANIFTAGSLTDFNLSVDTYTGGTGSDTIRLFNSDNSSMTLDLGNVSSLSSKLSGIEHFDLSTGSNANTLRLTLQNVLDMADSDEKIFIHGDASDTVNLSSTGGSWAQSTATIQGIAFNTYAQGGATIYIEQDMVQNVTVS